MREIVQRAASVENVASTHNRPVSVESRVHSSMILVAHSARPVDLDGVVEDFVRLNDQRKDDFGL